MIGPLVIARRLHMRVPLVVLLIGLENCHGYLFVEVVLVEKLLHRVSPQQGDTFLHRLIVLVLPLGVRIADIEIVFIL